MDDYHRPLSCFAAPDYQYAHEYQYQPDFNYQPLCRPASVISSNVDQQLFTNRLDELTSLVRQLAVNQTPQVDAAYPQQYHPCFNSYDPGWNNQSHLQWGQNSNYQSDPFNSTFQPEQSWQQENWQQQQNWQQHPSFMQHPAPEISAPSPPAQPQGGGPSLEDLVKQMATHNLEFQQRTEAAQLRNEAAQQRTAATIQNLQIQIGQLANELSQNRPQAPNSLPSQTILNPNINGKNVSAITLRSGRQTVDPAQPENTSSKEAEHGEKVDPREEAAEPSIPVPFPQRLTQSRKLADAALEKETLDTFRKVEVNIPLLDAIKQIPRYAKFLKELCTNKRRLNGNERVSLSKNVSALIQPMPPKCKDPGTFTIPCIFGNYRFDNCMLDLGASINALPTYVHSRTLSMDFGDKLVKFNIFDAMRQPREAHSILHIDVIDNMVDEFYESLHAYCVSLDCADNFETCCTCNDHAWCHICADFPDTTKRGVASVLLFELHVPTGFDIHKVDNSGGLSCDADAILIPHNIDLHNTYMHGLPGNVSYCIDSLAGTDDVHVHSAEQVHSLDVLSMLFRPSHGGLGLQEFKVFHEDLPDHDRRAKKDILLLDCIYPP